MWGVQQWRQWWVDNARLWMQQQKWEQQQQWERQQQEE